MSILTGIEAWWSTTEADVLALIAQIKSDEAIAQAELAAALKWVNNNIPSINAGIAEINGVLQTIAGSGVVAIPASVGTAIEDANKAVAALNAYQASIAAGGSTTAAVLTGYSAIKTAQSATALATLAVVNMPAAVPAAAAAGS